MNKKLFKSLMLLITYFTLLIVTIVKVDVFIGFFNNIILTLTPLFIGIAIAFILNGPYTFFWKKYNNAFQKNKDNKLSKLSKLLSIATVYILFFGIVSGVIAFLIPQLSASIEILYANLANYGENIESFLLNLNEFLKLETLDATNLNSAIEKIPDMVSGILTGIFPQIFNFTSGFVKTVINIVIGFIISIYLLADKDHIKRQFSNVLIVCATQKAAKRIIKITKMVIKTFTNFITGQITEVLILGTLCFIGMVIFGFDYALLISVIITITSLIPIAGPIIGLIPALFILLMIEPMQAAWFLLYFVILQQIEGNLIYPKVVGDSIGLPALWVLLAIIIGGGLFGVLGMILGVPTASVIYQLMKEAVHSKLDETNNPLNV
ncbi:MAG: AI-2E family transporter [Firmicutes bacterium HGW-Firmicutes-7]|nr:MAG: AI-2E family transporter [Firmicutes bacterium HGW-Firmicutes-7]